ncbi:MAG: cytochrome c [Acidobacteriota bacterium]|nr:cytochrome c [Acidobacteriota bacterium]
MRKLKLFVVVFFVFLGLLACAGSDQKGIVIADSKTYSASLFRQNCAICHGAEADGKTLDDGKIVPSLRGGVEHKFNSPDEIYRQISAGGNGMLPFGKQLSDRELRLMTEFVYKDLRGN